MYPVQTIVAALVLLALQQGIGVAQSLQRSVLHPGKSVVTTAGGAPIRMHWTFGQTETIGSTNQGVRLTRGYEQGYRDRPTTAILYTTNAQGRAGDTVQTQIRLDGLPIYPDAQPDSIRLTVVVNVTLLAPVHVAGRGVLERDEIGDTLRTVTVCVAVDKALTDQTLARLSYVAGLGDDSTTRFYIERVEFVGNNMPHVRRHGLFRLLDLCVEGGPRLIDPRRVVVVGIVAPNPVQTDARVDVEILESATVTVEVFNVQGSRERTMNLGTLEAGSYSVQLPVEELPSGTYGVVFQVGRATEYRLMVIRR